MGFKTLAVMTAALAITAAAPAAAGIIYMTGPSDPWGQTTENNAMDLAFGAGNWSKVYGFSTSVLTSANSFVYMDGGNGQATNFNSFVLANLPALEAYVTNGGALVLNAGRWDFAPATLPTLFGTSITGDPGYTIASLNAALTGAGLAAGLDANGAGSAWSGGYFSHDIVSGGTCLVSGDFGCVFTVGTAGAGSFGIGGQTAPLFHSSGGTELRANQLAYVADAGGVVPEPASWAMLIAGFGLVGAVARRRRAVAA
jgi:hypothetical protein